MKSIKDIIPKFMKEKGFDISDKQVCEVCNHKTKIVISDGTSESTHCRTCENQQLIKDLKLPTKEEYRQKKEMGYILNFERVTADLKDVTVNSYKHDEEYPSQEEAKQSSVDFIVKYTGKESLVLSGVSGIGKSHLSYAINKAIRNKGYKTLFIKTTDLLDAIKETYGYHSQTSQEQIFKMIDQLDLLVLDDLGGEYEKKNDASNETWASDVLYKVVDMRLGKSLIVTTNYPESELIKKYGQVQGERIVSRMMENATAIRVEGADKRRKERF